MNTFPCKERCRHRCGECRLGLGIHTPCDPQCTQHERNKPTMHKPIDREAVARKVALRPGGAVMIAAEAIDPRVFEIDRVQKLAAEDTKHSEHAALAVARGKTKVRKNAAIRKAKLAVDALIAAGMM